MKKYIITLKPKSFFSTIPKAYTIFGSLCWALKDLYNEDLEEYINNFKENPFFLLSNTYFYDSTNGIFYFPKPLSLMPDIKKDYNFFKPLKNYFYQEYSENYDKNLEEKAFKVYLSSKVKKFKKTKYITSEDFFALANGKETIENIFGKAVIDWIEGINGIEVNNFVIQHSSVDRLTGTTNEEHGTFYENVFALSKNLKLFFILETNEIDKILPALRFVFDRGIGKRKTTGKGQFNLEVLDNEDSKKLLSQMEENDSLKSDFKINLGTLIPSNDEFDFDSSYYSLDSFRGIVEDRYPFYGKNIFKARVVYIKEGSVLKVKNKKNFYGSLPIVKHIDENNIFHYGIGFMMNFNKKA